MTALSTDAELPVLTSSDDDPLARRPDKRHVAQRALLDQIDDRTIDAGGQGLRRALVAETAPLGALQDGQIVQQAGRDDVPIVPHLFH